MLINDSYRKQLQQMHTNPKTFSQGRKAYSIIADFLQKNKIESLIDFGCGKGGLIQCVKELNPSISNVQGYDPGISEYEKLPKIKFDALVSTDALEHVEPEFIDQTLQIIDKLFTKSCFLRIACRPAKKILPDGRNAHLIIEQPEWWLEKINKFISGEIIYKAIIPYSSKKYTHIKGNDLDLIIKKNNL